MKLVGFKRFSGKNGQDYCLANVVTPYTRTELEHGNVGERVDEIFLPNHLVNLLVPGDIGKELKAEYTISGSRAYLENVSVVK